MWARILACGAILGMTALGAWERTIQSGKGTIANNPPPRPPPVTFRFVDGRAVVTSSKYEPYLLH